jgi:hypothetical protein
LKEAMFPAGKAREVNVSLHITLFFNYMKLIAIASILRYDSKVFYNFQSDFGREVPLFEVEATAVEPVFQKLYSYIFDMDSVGSSVTEMDKPVPSAIFIVNFDKV